MTEAAVELVQCTIPDDPEQRRAALVAAVVKYCSHIFSPRHSVEEEGTQQGNSNVRSAEQQEKMEPSDFCVERLSGGITNELFHVYHPRHPSWSVVLRIFGKETERVISRESEHFYQSLFLPTYVRGTNFLIYQFLDMYEAIPFTELSLEYHKVAHAIAAFQVRATLEARCDRHKPVFADDERLYWNVDASTMGDETSGALVVCRFDREENYTIHALTKLIEQMGSTSIVEKVSLEKREEFEFIARKLQVEASWMLEVLLQLTSELGESVCHNDLLSANIMRHTKTGSLKFIDFDYTKRNYFLFDIANHFNEYAGLECDYNKYFPSDDDMTRFISVYREAMRGELQRSQDETRRRNLDEIIPNQERLFLSVSSDEEVERQKTARMVQLVKVLTLASHISWSVWAMLQEAVSTLEMDFLEYAKLRLARYLEKKNEYSGACV